MKKFDKTFGTKYRSENDTINLKSRYSSKRNVFYFYWQGKRIVKDCSYSGWADLVNDIFKIHELTDSTYFDYSLRFMDKYNEFSDILNYGKMLYNNYYYKMSIHYDDNIIEDILKPSRIIIHWHNGFNHCINFKKEHGYFIECKINQSTDHYDFTIGDVFIEHGLVDQQKAIKALLRDKFEHIPEEFKVDSTINSMDYDSLCLLLEMSTI